MNYKRFMFLGIWMMLFISCGKDGLKAPLPTPEDQEKGHEQWYKLEFVFTQGNLSNTQEDVYLEKAVENTSEGIYPVTQKFTYQWDGKNVIADQKKPVLLEKGKTYALEIFYYNKKGALMNHEFITEQMAPIHQHFFVAKDISTMQSGVEKGTKENLISYVYRDTQPYDKNFGEPDVSLRSKNDPIGLKGYFTAQKAYQKFNLKISLAHVLKGTKLKDDGSPRKFYEADGLVGTIRATTDLELEIPMEIFTDGSSTHYISDVFTALGVSKEEAEKEIQRREQVLKSGKKVKL